MNRGFLRTAASFTSDLTLVVEVGMGFALAAGMVLASGTVLFAGNQPGVARVHKGEGQNNQTCESQTESSFLHLRIRSIFEN